MPSLPGKSCRVPGCVGVATLKNNGYCDKHKNKGWENFQNRQGNKKRIYQLPIWRKLRVVVINRASGLCENCASKGLFVIGTEVDHKRPVSQGGAEDDINNLQLLCKQCHATKTANE